MVKRKVILIRIDETDLQKLKLDFDRYLVKNGYWKERGNRRSFNAWLCERLKKKLWCGSTDSEKGISQPRRAEGKN